MNVGQRVAIPAIEKVKRGQHRREGYGDIVYVHQQRKWATVRLQPQGYCVAYRFDELEEVETPMVDEVPEDFGEFMQGWLRA